MNTYHAAKVAGWKGPKQYGFIDGVYMCLKWHGAHNYAR